VDRGGLDAAIALSPEAVGQVASTGTEDDELGRLLASLDAACPGSGKAWQGDCLPPSGGGFYGQNKEGEEGSQGHRQEEWRHW